MAPIVCSYYFYSLNFQCCLIIFYRITISLITFKKFMVRWEHGILMTINKSQGQTVSHVGLFPPQSVFSHKQFYDAISRVTRRKRRRILICDKDGEICHRTKNVVYILICFKTYKLLINNVYWVSLYLILLITIYMYKYLLPTFI